MTKFESWEDIKKWAENNGFKNIPKRMQINNDCWASSGEFGRSQVAICDALRFASSEEERLQIAQEIEQELSDDIVLELTEEKTTKK